MKVRRLIEADLPIRRISNHSRQEKAIRQGHLATLHIWWARRPLAACRAVILATLWPDPLDENCPAEFLREAKHQIVEWAKNHKSKTSPESSKRLIAVEKNPSSLNTPARLREALLDFIADFADWDHASDRDYLALSRTLTQAAGRGLSESPRPLVVDPFAGGGAIPLEAVRVGADAFASDLNPIPVLLNKVVLEYIPRHGNKLAEEFRKWGLWVRREAEKELAEFYPSDADGSVPIAYLWARTVRCEAPNCGAEIPLMRSLSLAKRGRAISLEIEVDKKRKHIHFSIQQGKKPGEGTIRRGSASCPVCGYTTPVARVRAQLRERSGGAADARLLCVVTTNEKETGRQYRLPTKQDVAALREVRATLDRRSKQVGGQLSFVPDEPLPPEGTLGFRVQKYGIDKWGLLYTPRQALALATLAKLVRRCHSQISKGRSAQLAEAVTTLLAFAVDKQADLGNSLNAWEPIAQCPRHLFGRQVIPMVWDFAESVPLGDSSGSWSVLVDGIARALDNLGSDWVPGTPAQADAAHHPLPDDSAQAVITDPPYYDAVPYADLSDFFYVWLKRSIGELHPELFKTQLTPKSAECIVNPVAYGEGGVKKDAAFFIEVMRQALIEARRIVRPDGLGVVVFAHKSTSGWEAQLQATMDAGWAVTASWPLDTENTSRLRAQNSAALASSIHIVCRPRIASQAVGDWRDVLAELPKRIHAWMPRLAEEGVVGADAIFACLGPALEVFSRFERVEKPSGAPVLLKEYLEHVWAAVEKEALASIFSGADATGFEEDARLTAMWLWTLSSGSTEDDRAPDPDDSAEAEGDAAEREEASGLILEYDTARKMAQGLGAHLENLDHLVVIKKSNARLLSVAERAVWLFEKEDSTRKQKRASRQVAMSFTESGQKDSENVNSKFSAPAARNSVLDRLHQTMLLFGQGRGDALRRFLVDDGVGSEPRFWRLAQALAALYPNASDEKRWVDGVLARKKSLGF